MVSGTHATSFEQLKREKLLNTFIPIFFRVRLLVLPFLLLLLYLYGAYDEPRWKLLSLGVTVGVATTFFVYELVRYGLKGATDWTIGLNLLVIACLQSWVFHLTGGLESPIAPAAFLFVIATHVIYERGPWGYLVYGVYAVAFTLMAFGDFFGWLPNAGPTFFRIPGGFSQKPAYFWTLYAVYMLMLTNTGLMSRSLSRMLGQYYGELTDARLQVVQGFGARMRELETIGSRMAHEIKNPLAAIQGLVQVMSRRAEKASREEERLGVVQQEVSRITAIVNELSNFSRPLDELRTERIDLQGLLRAIENLYEARFAQAGVRVMHNETAAEPLWVRGDERKLKQVLINLLENAVHAMPEGGTMGMSIRRVADGAIEVVLSDSGIGIPPEHRDRLFDPFFTTREQGTGLGLTIARGIIEQHDGTLDLVSEVGEGTRVTVRLPAAPEEKVDA